MSLARAFILTFKGTQSTVRLPKPLWRSHRGKRSTKQRPFIKISPTVTSWVQTNTLAPLLTHGRDQTAGIQQRQVVAYSEEGNWGLQQGGRQGWQGICIQRWDKLVFWVRTLMKMLKWVDEHLFWTMSGWPDVAFDARLCHSPIKQLPVPFINIAANNSSSPQSVAFHMNTGVFLSAGKLKRHRQCGCQLCRISVIVGI